MLIAPREPPIPQEATDGRVRNAIPSTLSGKTDTAKGRFSVMQISSRGQAASNRASAEERAKQTSEDTQAAAKRAFEAGYVPLRHRKFVLVPDDGDRRAETSKTAVNAPPRQLMPLSPVETKFEQARLLTLLRSLQPVLVVDQLCKALAYFGGIPGGIPPADGKFPPSDAANGPGQLFVGWISEIFPRLAGHETDWPVPAVPRAEAETPRKRGRPKGSKASHPRSDKGIKKGPKKRPDMENAEGEDSWVDVDDSVMDLTAGLDEREAVSNGDGVYPAPVAAPPVFPALQPSAATHEGRSKSLTGKKRGRPKGVKDKTPRRPRGPPARPTGPEEAAIPLSQPSQVPDPVPALVSSDIPQPSPAVVTPVKNKGGRPKGSKDKKPRKSTTGAAYAASASAAAHATPKIPRKVSQVPLPTIPGQPRLVAGPTAATSAAPNDSTGPPTSTETSVTISAKRKRKSAPDLDGNTAGSADSSQRTGLPNGSGTPATNGAANPNKRPRQSKGPATTAPAPSVPDLTVMPGDADITADLAALQDTPQDMFDVQSPTMENYEAQLQAQFEHQESAQARPQQASQPASQPFSNNHNATTTWQQKPATQTPSSAPSIPAQSIAPSQPTSFAQYQQPSQVIYGSPYTSQTQQRSPSLSVQQQSSPQNASNATQFPQYRPNFVSAGDSGYRSSSPHNSMRSSTQPIGENTLHPSTGQSYTPQQQQQMRQQQQARHRQAQQAPPSYGTLGSQSQPQASYQGYGDQSGLFNMSNLATSYGGLPRNARSSPSAAAYSNPGMGSFDASGADQGQDRFYGVGRR
jgi:hypothetical protein